MIDAFHGQQNSRNFGFMIIHWLANTDTQKKIMNKKNKFPW